MSTYVKRAATLYLLWIAIAGFAADKPPTICEIAKSPAAFDGKSITVTGRLLIAYESRDLTSRSCKFKIWTNLSDESYAKVRNRWNQPIDVEVTGVLHTARKSYGHMGAWPAELDVQTLKILNPAPPAKV
jgi:hypothetical protein